ncbi:hypothetical protein RRG08_038556, partial [Elysia crispata]
AIMTGMRFVPVSKICFIYHVTLTALTVIVFSRTIYGGQTPCTTKGWFGPNCQYQCHCAWSAPCDKHDGYCSSGCHRDWFGPACQYARMGMRLNGNSKPRWLTDNKDTTCITGTHRSVTVTLDTPIPLTWLRVVLSDAVHLSTVKISYRNKSSNSTECPESNTAKINKVSADISCPTEYPVTSVTLSGLGVDYLCSLYISAGRNVALKQRAEQSSRYDDGYSDRWLAKHAVDGTIPAWYYYKSTCSHTGHHDTSPWWQVSFTHPVEITRFILENRRDCCHWRLVNFSLTVYPVNGPNKPITYRGSDQPKYTYKVVPSPKINFPITQVKITKGFNRDNILTLCEVFIFGDIHCPFNRYGLKCERECNCVNQTSCFVHSGRCSSGCAPGYTGIDCSKKCKGGRYGIGCTRKCSVTCGEDQDTCNHTDGACTHGCDPGYTGRWCEGNCNATCGGDHNICNQTDGACTQGCDPGYTGRWCEGSCNATCGGDHNICNQTDGACTQGCDPGYTGRWCEGSCNATCGGDHNICNQTDGTCTQGCDPGYTGRFCQSTCHRSTYGVRCSQNCSVTCGGPDSLCHHVDGNCSSGCNAGFKGEHCNNTCPNGSYGDGCEKTCSDHCAGDQNSCHYISGVCDQGCDPGYQGSLCIQATVQLGVILGAAVIALITCTILVGVFLRRCRKQKAKEVKDSISVSGTAAPSVGDHGRHEPSRTSEAGAFPADSHTGQTSTSEPKSVSFSLERQYMDGDRAEDKKLGRGENMEKDIERKRVKDIEGDRVYDNQDGDHSDTAVPVETLNTYIRQHATDSHFLEEFSSVPMVTSSPRTAGISPQNVKKNRYKNIIPYNSTRVLLQRDHKKNQSDYINASYVKGYATDELYIASQAPSDRIINDFMRMIWEQRVDRVVMLTNLTEEGKKKCSMYWPVDGEDEFGDVSVRLLTTHVFAEYTIRYLRLSK